MNLKKIPHKLTVCKVSNISDIDLNANFYFIGKTDEEVSLVCKTEDTPSCNSGFGKKIILIICETFSDIFHKNFCSIIRHIDSTFSILARIALVLEVLKPI